VAGGLRWSEQAHAEWKAREVARTDDARITLPIVGTANAQDKPRPKLKLTKTEAPEAAVLDAVLKMLHRHRRVVFANRMNSGAGRFIYPDGTASQFIRFGFVGMPDILGMLRDGVMLACEVKSPSGHPTVEQANFLAIVRSNGGVAFIARGISDVLRELGPA